MAFRYPIVYGESTRGKVSQMIQVLFLASHVPDTFFIWPYVPRASIHTLRVILELTEHLKVSDSGIERT